MQRFDHFRRDALRLPILRPAVNDAMPHCRQFAVGKSLLHPIHQQIDRRRMVRHGHGAAEIVRRFGALNGELALGKADALDSSRKNSPQRPATFKQRKLDGRRTTVDGQNPVRSRIGI